MENYLAVFWGNGFVGTYEKRINNTYHQIINTHENVFWECLRTEIFSKDNTKCNMKFIKGKDADKFAGTRSFIF